MPPTTQHMFRLAIISIAVVIVAGCGSESNDATSNSGSGKASFIPLEGDCGCTSEQTCVKSCDLTRTQCVDTSTFRCSLGEADACGLCFDQSFAPSSNPCMFGTTYSASCSHIERSKSSYIVSCACR